VTSRSQNLKLQEKCAVFGAYNAGQEAARLAFYGLWAMQHRGQESSGIVTSDQNRLYSHNGQGLVAEVYHDEDLEQLPGKLAIGHNRYSTSGGAGSAYNQPFVDHERHIAFAHNGNLPLLDKLTSFFAERNVDTRGFNDSGMMFEAIGCLMDDGMSLEKAIIHAFPLFQGAFSAVAMDKDRIVAFRDQCGIRPLSLGKLGDGYVFASETCAFDAVGATFVRHVEPGELVVIDERGITSHQIVPPNQKLDIFEFVYFARPDSVMLGRLVSEVRKKLGHELAKEFPIDADMVVPVPDSSIYMAAGYAEQSGVPLEMGLVRNRYIHRTFIRPSQGLRQRDVQLKLNPLTQVLKGKRVILIDDSIVRGTTMKQVVKMMYRAGVKELHLLISSPPVRYPDFYGIDTPSQKDLIASSKNVKEIEEYLEADSLHYLSFDGMIKATDLSADLFCTSCFDGNYPIPIGDRAKEITAHKKEAVGAKS
jgi:amidophosphoribosyltransferase